MEVNSPKTDVNIELPYQEPISRLFVFRFLWVFPLMFVMILWSIWVSLVALVHFFYMLFLGRRDQKMFNIQADFFKFMVKWNSYLSYLTDRRPNLTNAD